MRQWRKVTSDPAEHLRQWGVYENSHLAGKIAEKDGLEQLYVTKGGRVKLTIPDEGKNKGNSIIYEFGGINITINTDPKNTDQVTSGDIDLKDPEIKPKNNEN